MQAPTQHSPNIMNTTVVDAQTIIFGLGETGLSCARFLAARGIEFAAVDTRERPPAVAAFTAAFPSARIETGFTAPDRLGRCEQMLLSPGVPREHPVVRAALARGVEVIGDIELFARHARAPVVAVTGSNGKSTVVTMVSAILAAAGLDVRTGGNIGTPALDLIGESDPDCYVLELSSFQLESTRSLAPVAAALLNISPDHMDRYATFADYVAAKLSIADRAHIVVVNFDDPALAAATLQATIRGFSLHGAAGACYGTERADGTLWLVANGERIINVDEIAAGGEHNRINALAAIALTDTMAVSRSAQRTALMTFTGLPHRCQTVRVCRGVEWIDDSKGTNVGATCAAIAGVFVGRKGVLIAGGQGKGADFGPLADALSGRVHSIVLIGEDAAAIARAVESVVDVQFALDMRAAVATAASLAEPGEAVLLSPACASFDMFENFAARGKAFAAAVNEVAGV